MNFKKTLMAFMVIMLMGTHSVAYAGQVRQENTRQNNQQTEMTQEGLAELYHKAGLDSPEIIMNTLVDLGISNQELQAAVQEGKKIYDLLQEKEIKMVNFKKSLTEQYKCRIKQARKEKVITRKEAKVLTKLLKERMAQWEI